MGTHRLRVCQNIVQQSKWMCVTIAPGTTSLPVAMSSTLLPSRRQDRFATTDRAPALRRRFAAGTTGDPGSAGRWIGPTVIAVIVILATAAIAAVTATTLTNTRTAADETVRRIGERTAGLVDSHLAVASAAIADIDAVATDEVFDERSASLDRLLAAKLVAHPQLSGAFVGFDDGSFNFAFRDGDELVVRRIDTTGGYTATDSPLLSDLSVLHTVEVDTDYDPRTRPWYIAAESADGGIWTDPYVFFRSGEPGVTLARARSTDRHDIVVVGVDISIANLNGFLDGLPIDDGAEAYLLAGADIVAAPSSLLDPIGPDGELLTSDAIGVSEAQLRRLDDGPIDAGDGQRLHLTELGDGSPQWSVLIRTTDTGIMEALTKPGRIAIGTILLAAIALVAATPWITRWLRRPIDELRTLARVDSLTEVANRRTFLEEASHALARSVRLGTEFSVAVIDIDDFKQINDVQGHAAGDDVLQCLGATLRANLRTTDLVGRMGGDELAIAFTDVDRTTARRLLARVRGAIGEQHAPLSVTIGATTRDGRAIDLPTLLSEADRELLDAKQERKGSVRWRPEWNTPASPLRFKLD